MAESVPYIILAFASPNKDLAFIEDEVYELDGIFSNRRRRKRNFDFELVKDATRDSVLNVLTGLDNVLVPCFFHYSGHSDGVVLNWQDSESPSVFELSKILSPSIKIVFLNGCSTRAFVENLLTKTKVKAVIATKSPVGDKQAAKISSEFYRFFFTEQLPLDEAFDRLVSSVKNTTTCIDKTREIGFDKATKLDNNKEFLWGLFYSDPDILRCRFTDLVSKNYNTLEELKEKQRKAKKDLDEWEQALTEQTAGSIGYNKTKEAADEARNAWQKITDDIENIKTEIDSTEINLTEQEKQRDFEFALRLLNYDEQRDGLVLGKHCFGGFAFLGDQHSFHELLCYNFKWENNIRRSPKTYLIDANARHFEGFWKKLAFDLGVEQPMPVKPADEALIEEYNKDFETYTKALVKKLLDEQYLNWEPERSGDRPTKKDVIIKIKMGNIDTKIWMPDIIMFWTQVELYLQTFPPANNVSDFEDWHKLVLLLLDENSSAEKYVALQDQFNKISLKLPSLFKALPPISPLNQEELAKWIKKYRLHTVGFTEQDAADWYAKSDQGKLVNLIYLLKEKTKYNDLEIFKILSLEHPKE